jgi:peptidoglycan/xylan/chitin deacetylase (PgdA/CDA1 family)
MYHGVQDGMSRVHPYFETRTSPRRFAEQMKYLRDSGYRAVDLKTATQWTGDSLTTERFVVITFDDGYEDFYTAACPILREYGLSATVFLPSGLIGNQRLTFEDKEYMSWAEVRDAASWGMQIGSHTVTHPKLEFLSTQEVDDEVGRSRQMIEDQVGRAVTSFSYPFAFPQGNVAFVNHVREMLSRHGYENGVSTVIGTAHPHHDRFFLPRVPVNVYDDLKLFRAKLEGGYNWLRGPQHVAKVLKRVHRSIRPGKTKPGWPDLGIDRKTLRCASTASGSGSNEPV